MVDAREFGKIKDLAKYEEVWVHSCWLPMTLKACRRVVKAKRPLVRMTHANLDPVRLRYHGWKKWLVGPIERYLLRRCEKIVATCDAEKEWIEAYEPGVKKIEIVDIKRFFKLSRVERVDRVEGDESVFNTEAQRRRGAENDELHLLYLGRRHPLKGVEFLEAAVSELNSSTPPLRTPPLLKIVSNAFGEELEKVWDWCDVLVLPTLSENFGLVVAEALERGKRVITTDGAPAWEELGVSDQGVGVRGEELVYLKGFRDGSDEERIKLLKDALMMMV
jgi:glycosyltransferase involved in cell wall biosynthesis